MAEENKVVKSCDSSDHSWYGENSVEQNRGLSGRL